MRKLTSRAALMIALVAVLSGALMVAGIASASSENPGQASAAKKKKKKPVLTSKQKKAINKMIDAKIKKIVIPTVPAGPAAYTAANAGQVDIPSDLNVSTPVLSKAIPAGKYAVSGHVNGFYLTNASTDEANLVCKAKLNGTTVQQAQAGNDAGIFLLVASAGTLNMPFDFAIDATAASTLSIDCSGGYDDPGTLAGEYVGAGQAVLTAVTVGSIG